MPSDNSRIAALSALERCRRAGAWSSASIESAIAEYKLDARERALASKIALGVLQNMTLCDYYIDYFSSSRSKIEPKVRDILREAVYQLLFMDKIPSSAAVNEAVKLCRSLGYGRASGFANAVLRRLASNRNSLPDIDGEGTARYLSVKYSHPLWLAEEMISIHGYEFAESFFKANNSEPYTAIQVNTLKTDTENLLSELSSDGIDAHKHPWLPDCILVKGNVTSLYGFTDGLFYVQDPAAKCAVLAMGLKSGMSVLDACAAPGGKSFAAAIAMKNEGSILSCDLHEKKLRLIDDGAKRLGLDIISTLASDARDDYQDAFDAVIADVPCSGYGVIRKKPEIRYKPENERTGLPAIQSDILDKLSRRVKVGGLLMYSTCTIFPEENENVVKSFLGAHEEFSAEDFRLPGGWNSTGGMLTFYPHIHGTDGFFTALLRRNG